MWATQLKDTVGKGGRGFIRRPGDFKLSLKAQGNDPNSHRASSTCCGPGTGSGGSLGEGKGHAQGLTAEMWDSRI